MGGAAGQGFLDTLAEHEMRAEKAHRLTRRGPHRGPPEPTHQVVEGAFRRLMAADDARRNAECPGRGGNQQRV
jgi:hypothetical protein